MENDDEWNQNPVDEANHPDANFAPEAVADVSPGVCYQAFDWILTLPYNIKYKIFKMLDKKSMLIVSSVCWDLNQIVSPLITKNFYLAIKLNSSECYTNTGIADMFTTILTNALNEGRKYNKVVLSEVHWMMTTDFRSLVLFALSVVGQSLKDLLIKDSTVSYLNGVELLGCFNNIERLELKYVDIDFLSPEINSSSIMPHLKDLKIVCSTPQSLNWFLHCRNLEVFEFELNLLKYVDFPLEYDTQKFENFLIAQENLKHLVLSYLLHLDMFKEDRSGDVKFQLKSIALLETYFQNSVNALKFFQTQKNINCFESWIENNDERLLNGYREILKFVYSSPTLLKVTTNIGFTNTLDFSTNPSMKCLQFSEPVDSNMILSMMKLFPTTEDIYINSTLLSLDDFKCEKLRLIKFYKQLMIFKYQPTTMEIDDRQTFEVMVKCFLLRNNKIKSLTIGSIAWVQNGFGLSLKFCIDLLKFLPSLTSLELYNPLQIKNFVMFLLCSRRNFESISLYTDEAGKAAVKRMRKSCLNVVVV